MSQIDNLNTAPLVQFIQQVKQADSSRSQEIRIPIDKAKTLAFTLGIVMSRLHGDLEKFVAQNNKRDDEVIEISLDGGKI